MCHRGTGHAASHCRGQQAEGLAFLCSTASISESLELDESAREQLQRYHEPKNEDALTKPDVFFAVSAGGTTSPSKGCVHHFGASEALECMVVVAGVHA